MMRSFFLALTVFCLVAGTNGSFAQEPTLEETIKFIQEKCNIRFEAREPHDYRIQKVSIKDCQIVTDEDYPLRNEHRKQTASLKDLDPTRIEIVNTGDSLFGYRAGMVYVYTFKDKNEVAKDGSMTNRLLLWTLPDVHTEKAAKAIVHLIKLCGGKGELF